MKRLLALIGLLIIGCSSNITSPEEDCGCGFDITSTLPVTNGIHQLEFNQNSAQTYSTLDCETECGWSQHIQWDSDYMYQIVPNQWISLVNPATMTDEYGEGKIVFAVWEEFIGRTITIYGGYTDDCGHHFVDSLKVKVVNNE
jgi:hypothetical protein|tara:strand:- start:2132 stop:2560 length:429 start_codon:yes stop_codon:yes gene_type:complete